MTGEASKLSASSTGQVSAAVQGIIPIVRETTTLLNELEQRLEPVLRDKGPHPTAHAEGPSQPVFPTVTPLLRELEALAQTAIGNNCIVRDLTERAEA